MTLKEMWLDQYAFKEFVPATNDPRFGWPRLPIEEALTKRYILTNPAKLTSMVVVDVDKEDAASHILSKAWDDETAPEPNWITINPGTTHAHAGYWLKSPVATSDAGSQRAREFLYDIQKKLTVALSGDSSYRHHATRSPFMLNHLVRFDRADPYDLRELSESLKDIKLQKTYKLDTAQGRNVSLFESVRFKAYEMRLKFVDYPKFHDFILQFTDETNRRMNSSSPLPYSEVKSVASSISKWTWRNLNEADFRANQTWRINHRWEKVRNGDVTGEKRLLRLSETRDELLFLKDRGLTHSEIARATGLTKDQVKSKLRYARKIINQDSR